ncbi:MAG TPA: hypothetical protein VF794_02590 [Archangium sp.]|jgi:hypothetical protein|uniref:hypothetical protein n=1 Tax=Archangium sp. TaxID=1872627 RepID=UPI002ED9B623
METNQANTLQLPSFLHGAYGTIKRKAKTEGRHCAKQYQLSGAFPQPRELRTVAPGEVVLTHNVVDFQDEEPAWRLYMVSELIMSLCEVDEKNHRHLDNMYETSFRETAWGALYFALSGRAPDSAARTALRLEAVVRFWDSLQHGRYLHQKLNTFLNLDELLTTACGWAMDAWCPKGEDSVRSRLAMASESMARATRADCVEAILRQLPHILPFADRQKLNHPEVVTDPTAWRDHLASLDAAAFERISAVRPGWVLQRLYQWDRQLDLQ